MQLSKLLYKNIFWRGLNMASVFVLNILIAQVFGAAVYGELYVFINSLAFLVLVSSFCIDSGLIYFGAKNKLNETEVISFALAWTILISIIALMFILFATKWSNSFFCFLFLFGMLLITFFSALFTAKHHYFTQNIIIVLCNVLLSIAFFFIKNNVEKLYIIFFTAIFIQGIFIALVYIIKYAKEFTVRFFSKEIFLKIINYSGIALLANITFFLVYRIDYWFVDYFISDKVQLGNYIQVSKVGQLFFIIPSILASTIFAVTAQNTTPKIVLNIVKISKALLLLTITMCVPLIIFGKWAFPFVFGNTFSSMYLPFLFLLPGIFALAIQTPFSAYFAGKNRQHISLYGNLFALLIICVGDYFMVPFLGINGASIMCSIAYIFFTLYLLYHFSKQNKISFLNSLKISWIEVKDLFSTLKNSL